MSNLDPKDEKRILNDIANKEDIIKELEADNKNGQYDQEISRQKNDIDGLKERLKY